MKPIFITIAVLLNVFVAWGKNREYPRADIKVGYTYHETFVRSGDGIIERDIPFVLLAGDGHSKFYCPSTEYKDSLDSTPSGRALGDRMLHEAIRKYSETGDDGVMDAVVYKSFLYIFKSAAANGLTVYDKAGMFDYGYYTEPMGEIDWEIGDSTKVVLGYECVMASADYHGRRWTAWFAPDLPVSDGPWKLCGLPGLILEASEADGQHWFAANGIEWSDKEIYPIYNADKYEKMSRRDMLRAHRDKIDHGASITAAATGISLGSDHEREGAELYIDFLETDYHE